jgi:hypothetical protein
MSFDQLRCEHGFDHTLVAQNRSRSELGVASAQPILTCQFDLAHSDSNKNGTLVPQLERRGESKCTSGRTNIDCNNIGVPHPRVRATWVPAHARPCTVDDVEFYYLKLIQHLCNVTCRPLTLWPSDRYGPRWAGREAWVTYGDGRTRGMPADAARGSTPLMTLLPRHYHARIVKHYAS